MWPFSAPPSLFCGWTSVLGPHPQLCLSRPTLFFGGLLQDESKWGGHARFPSLIMNHQYIFIQAFQQQFTHISIKQNQTILKIYQLYSPTHKTQQNRNKQSLELETTRKIESSIQKRSTKGLTVNNSSWRSSWQPITLPHPIRHPADTRARSMSWRPWRSPRRHADNHQLPSLQWRVTRHRCAECKTTFSAMKSL